MPKVSKQSVPAIEMGPSTEWRDNLGGYTVEIVNVKGDTDLTPLFVGLPNDQCSSSHWGYVFKGRMWFRSDAGEETFGPGDAFYVAPGHTAGADDGSEFLVFSPTDVMAPVEEHMMRRAQALHGH